MINPLFEAKDVDVLDLENDFNVDTLSDCCNQSDCSFSVCDCDYLNDVVFCELRDKVLDQVVFKNEPTLHDKFHDDQHEVRENQHFSCDFNGEVLDEVVSEQMPTPCTQFNDEYFNVSDLFSDYDESVESPRLFLVIDKDSIDKYKCGHSFDCHPVVPAKTQFQGVSNLFPNFDSMHVSFGRDSYQFDPCIFMHVDPYFNNEKNDKEVSSMHYEYQEGYFILPAEPIQKFNVW